MFLISKIFKSPGIYTLSRIFAASKYNVLVTSSLTPTKSTFINVARRQDFEIIN